MFYPDKNSHCQERNIPEKHEHLVPPSCYARPICTARFSREKFGVHTSNSSVGRRRAQATRHQQSISRRYREQAGERTSATARSGRSTRVGTNQRSAPSKQTETAQHFETSQASKFIQISTNIARSRHWAAGRPPRGSHSRIRLGAGATTVCTAIAIWRTCRCTRGGFACIGLGAVTRTRLLCWGILSSSLEHFILNDFVPCIQQLCQYVV